MKGNLSFPMEWIVLIISALVLILCIVILYNRLYYLHGIEEFLHIFTIVFLIFIVIKIEIAPQIRRKWILKKGEKRCGVIKNSYHSSTYSASGIANYTYFTVVFRTKKRNKIEAKLRLPSSLYKQYKFSDNMKIPIAYMVSNPEKIVLV